MQRVTKIIAEQAGLVTVRRKTGIWQTLKADIRLKQPWQEFESNSILIEFPPPAQNDLRAPISKMTNVWCWTVKFFSAIACEWLENINWRQLAFIMAR